MDKGARWVLQEPRPHRYDTPLPKTTIVTYGGKWFWATWHLSALQALRAEGFLGYGRRVEGFGVLHGGPGWQQSPAVFCFPCC